MGLKPFHKAPAGVPALRCAVYDCAAQSTHENAQEHAARIRACQCAHRVSVNTARAPAATSVYLDLWACVRARARMRMYVGVCVR